MAGMAAPLHGLQMMMALQPSCALACGCAGWFCSSGCFSCVSSPETLHGVFSDARVCGRTRPPAPGDRI